MQSEGKKAPNESGESMSELRANQVLKFEHQTISRQSLNLSGFHNRCYRFGSDNFNCGGRIVYLQWIEKNRTDLVYLQMDFNYDPLNVKEFC